MRLLGDAVLRRVAWKLADQLGWPETYTAEYLALTQLQADAFVTLDPELARLVEGIVPLGPIDALRAPLTDRAAAIGGRPAFSAPRGPPRPRPGSPRPGGPRWRGSRAAGGS